MIPAASHEPASHETMSENLEVVRPVLFSDASAFTRVTKITKITKIARVAVWSMRGYSTVLVSFIPQVVVALAADKK